MEAERGRRNGFPFSEGLMNGFVSRSKEIDGFATIPTSSSSSVASSSSPSSSPSRINYIQHRVSKMDTLVGVAIKYGVEVADIRRLNGLVTDLQMFAHKSIQIPLPGRHPPSPILSNGSAINREQTPPRQPLDDVLDSFQLFRLRSPQRNVSQAMSSLQGYYGLTPPKRSSLVEGTEMAVYRNGSRALCFEEEPMHRNSDPLPSRHRKSRSLVNGFLPEENGEINGEITDARAVNEVADSRDAERSIRRRQKADANPYLRTPELLLKEDTGGWFSGRAGTSLALRPKSGSRTDMDMGRMNSTPIGDLFLADGSAAAAAAAAVRKSSSTSNLQESENGSSSSIWPSSKWSMKPDSIAWPIYDGLPKPTGIRRNKAALD